MLKTTDNNPTKYRRPHHIAGAAAFLFPRSLVHLLLAPPACGLPVFTIPHANAPRGTCSSGMLLDRFPNSACRSTLGHLFPRHAAYRISRFHMPVHLAVLAPQACGLADFPIPHASSPWGTCFPGMLLTEFPNPACRFTLRHLFPRHAAYRISQFHMPMHLAALALPACCLPNSPIPHASSPRGTCSSGMLPRMPSQQSSASVPESPEKLRNPCDISVMYDMLKFNHRKQQTHETNVKIQKQNKGQKSKRKSDYRPIRNRRK